MQSGEGHGRLLILAGLLLGLASVPSGVQAELVLDRPNQRWKAGEVIELYLPRGNGQSVQIETVLFDNRPVPFDLIRPRNRDEVLRIRLRVPAGIKPGAHEISALFSEAAAVPRLLGLTLEEARRVLEARGLGLDAGAFRPPPSELVSHTVARQNPVAGTPARPGTRISVEVATSTEVPEIAGLLLEEARLELEPRGLGLDTIQVRGVPAPTEALTVVRYEPAFGTTVPAGTQIRVREVAITVPQVAGMRVEVARASLLDSGFVPLLTIHDAADGPAETILWQRPAAGSAVPASTEISMAIESRPDPPGPRWPLPEAVAVAALSATLQRFRARRMMRKEYKVEGHTDLDRLRRESTSPDLEDRELGLDLRLVGFTDPGRQTLEVDGPLALQETVP